MTTAIPNWVTDALNWSHDSQTTPPLPEPTLQLATEVFAHLCTPANELLNYAIALAPAVDALQQYSTKPLNKTLTDSVALLALHQAWNPKDLTNLPAHLQRQWFNEIFFHALNHGRSKHGGYFQTLCRTHPVAWDATFARLLCMPTWTFENVAKNTRHWLTPLLKTPPHPPGLSSIGVLINHHENSNPILSHATVSTWGVDQESACLGFHTWREETLEAIRLCAHLYGPVGLSPTDLQERIHTIDTMLKSNSIAIENPVLPDSLSAI